jgi:hypothetical protein
VATDNAKVRVYVYVCMCVCEPACSLRSPPCHNHPHLSPLTPIDALPNSRIPSTSTCRGRQPGWPGLRHRDLRLVGGGAGLAGPHQHAARPPEAEGAPPLRQVRCW